MTFYLELISVLLGLAYLFFLIKEQIICWLFGILSSITSVFLFYRRGLYSEAILYTYYVIIGVYGFIYWQKSIKKDKTFTVKDLPLIKYMYLLFLGEIVSLLLGYIFSTYTNASAPYLDAHTTAFSFIASYLEAKKYLASWKFWIVINAVTIILYINKDLNLYTGLTVIYLIFSFIGYIKWKQTFLKADL